MTLLRCAHLSDLHFSEPTWSPSQFFSKRWLGNLNLLLARKKVYTPDNLGSLVHSLRNSRSPTSSSQEISPAPPLKLNLTRLKRLSLPLRGQGCTFSQSPATMTNTQNRPTAASFSTTTSIRVSPILLRCSPPT